MAIIKCKMCGGDIPVENGEKVSTCRYCGLSVTLPNLDSEKKTRLFNKANDYRLNSDFDKAFELYKSIVQEDSGEAEAYWGMLLCEYGIEYVKESETGKRVPTCHRTKKQSIFDSIYYIQATKNASEDQKLIYRDEAESIDRLQKEILSVARQIEPYDVFICYKESDENGDRTNDSVLAQDIYESLTDKGFRTFFARISLEDKIGLN